MGEGRQPERRAEAQDSLAKVRTGSLALTMLDWEHVDTLAQDDIIRAHIDVCELQKRAADAQWNLGRAMAKRTGQSVSGRLQPQIDALTRRVREQQQSERSLAVVSQNERDLIEENEQLREKLDRAKALFVDGEVAV